MFLLWSFWWWTAYGVSYLVDDLDTTLYLSVNPDIQKNGYVKAIASVSAVSAALLSGQVQRVFVSAPYPIFFVYVFTIALSSNDRHVSSQKRHQIAILGGGLLVAGTLLLIAALSNYIWVTYICVVSCFFVFEFTFVACYAYIALQ